MLRVGTAFSVILAVGLSGCFGSAGQALEEPTDRTSERPPGVDGDSLASGYDFVLDRTVELDYPLLPDDPRMPPVEVAVGANISALMFQLIVTSTTPVYGVGSNVPAIVSGTDDPMSARGQWSDGSVLFPTLPMATVSCCAGAISGSAYVEGRPGETPTLLLHTVGWGDGHGTLSIYWGQPRDSVPPA